MLAPRAFLVAIVIGSSPLQAAEFRLASPFSDHMVLQRGKPVAVWGFGDDGEKVTVSFDGQSKQAVADGEGRSRVRLDATQFTQLVTSWRALWADDVPFAWVQLPGYRDSASEDGPRMRETMMKVLALPGTGMAITLDVGDPKDIHPKNNQEVGHRLTLCALGTVYGRPVPTTSFRTDDWPPGR